MGEIFGDGGDDDGGELSGDVPKNLSHATASCSLSKLSTGPRSARIELASVAILLRITSSNAYPKPMLIGEATLGKMSVVVDMMTSG